MTASLKEHVVNAARQLFLTKGYDAVGMREIAEAVSRQPVQVYRLGLSKSDILAELILELNQEQIASIPELLDQVVGTSACQRIYSYLERLYELDISYLPIRSVGAAHGWMWSQEHERRVFEQVRELVKPVADWMREAGLENIEARIVALWSLYYVGFRQAVVGGGSAQDCLASIQPSLRLLLEDPAAPAGSHPDTGIKAREGADLFQSLFETMPDGIVVIGAEGRFIEANQVALDRLGYSREELLQLGPRDINPPEAAQGVADTFGLLEREGRATFVTRHVRKDGSSFPVEIYSRRVVLAGKPAILSTARDISDRLEAAQAFAQEAAFARSIFNASKDSMAVVDPRGRILEVNEAWKRFGAQNNAGPEGTWSVGASYFRPGCGRADDGLALVAYEGIRNVQAGELPAFDLEYPCDAPNEPRWFVMRVVPVKGRPGVVLVSHRDDTARKLAWDRTLESETQLRTVTEFSHDWEYWEGTSRQIEYMSPSCQRVTGYPREAFLKDPSLLELIVHPDDRALMAAHRHDFLRPEPGKLEFRILRENGEVLWLDHVCRPVMGPDGEFAGRRVSNHDITERKAAERVRSHLAAIVASSDDAILSKSLDGTILTWNAAAVEMFGYSPEEAVGQPISMLLPEDRLAEDEQILDRINRGEKVYHLETVRTRKDGRLIDVSITVSPIIDEGGRLIGTSKILRDITERRRTEAALRLSEERYRKVAENLAEGLAVNAASGVYTYCNRRFAEMFGYSQEEILGLTPVDLVHREHRGLLGQKMKDRSLGHSERYELRMQKKGGEPIDCLVTASPLMDDAGTFLGTLALVSDFTEQKRLEESLRRAEKSEALGEMAAGLAHDFNNTFQGILTHLELAQVSGRLEQSVAASLARASEGLLQAAGLSQRILEFTGASLRQTETIRLVTWLRAQEMTLRAVASQAGSAEFRLALASADPSLIGDPKQLLAVLKALVLNAAEAISGAGQGSRGRILVSLTLVEEPAALPGSLFWAEPPPALPCLCLAVQDSGCGLSPGGEKRAFDPFHTTKAAGRGLGLAAALGIVRAHGGGIGIGPCPGGGTRVAVCLRPAETASAVPPGVPIQPWPSPEPSLPPGSILLADDEPVLLSAIAEVLEFLGHPVVTAGDGVEALERFRAHSEQIKLVILDARMPRMGGIEAFLQMRAQRPDLKGLLCTGYGEAFGQSSTKECGFSGFLAKPFKIEDLKRALDSMMQKP